jgi:general secretion pathway protein D
LPFQLGFDPAALQVVDVREGAFFQQGGVKTNFASNIDQKAGRIFVGLTRPGAEGAKGEDKLVTITFRAQSSNAKSELRLLAATPVAAGSAAITVALPQPASINVTR